MIIKARTVPRIILELETLLRRISKDHPKIPQIERELLKRRAGYKGELQVDYFLSLLPEEDFSIFCDLNLALKKRFQIDTLLASRNFLLVIESKNISGKIRIDPKTDQMIRTYREIEEGFNNPILQAKRQHLQLKNWLSKNKFPPVSVEYLAVVSNHTTLLDTSHTDPQVFKKLILAESLLEKIEKLQSKYQNPSLTKVRLHSLEETLLKDHQLPHNDILKKFDISKDCIIKGVQCPDCQCFSMSRISASWLCPQCKKRSKTSHEQAILDYFLLINASITNRQCRDFLCTGSSDVVNYLFKKMNLLSEGKGKGKKYFPSECQNKIPAYNSLNLPTL
ncbi:MAG: nuclease-related domain-containing protein [Bacillota bacterium]|nr:nuclease-related domain-containing protein [Bacillota bacterium]